MVVEEEYGHDSVNNMLTDFDYHINTEEWPELFDDESLDDFIVNLNDRD